MEPDNYERAYAAVQKALQLTNNDISTKEKALINALSKRYIKNPAEDRSQQDLDYSNAMGNVYKKFPDDADVAVLYAESMMNLHPWDLWDKKGNPKEWTPKIISTIDHAITINPKHPGAHHFYIHAVESSFEPEKGLKSAQLFDDDLVPGAGHLVHMPSHIYIRNS
jgi:hypothetical protein